MRSAAFALLFEMTPATAIAQLGGFRKAIKKANDAVETAQKLADHRDVFGRIDFGCVAVDRKASACPAVDEIAADHRPSAHHQVIEEPDVVGDRRERCGDHQRSKDDGDPLYGPESWPSHAKREGQAARRRFEGAGATASEAAGGTST